MNIRSVSFERRNKRGFAIIVTVSILVLLAVVAVGLLTLSTTVVRSSTLGNASAEARANAKVALIMAIGQLQKHAGDDRRVTMQADQLADAADGSVTAAAEDRRHWTGVYRSWLKDESSRPTPEFATWLVSSPNPSMVGEDDAKAAASGDNVELVGEGTVGEGNGGLVSAPLVQFDDRRGGLAWWTGDQGVKGMLALAEENPPVDDAGVRARMQAAATNEVGLASVNGEQPFAGVDLTDGRLEALTGWGQTDFLASDVEVAKPLFHDLVTTSSGMLTNVRAGGFRKDLSMALERRSGQEPTDPLYTVNGETGINLQELWVYYNLYKELRPGRGAYTTGGSIPQGASVLTMSSNAKACERDDEHFFKQPIIISYQMAFSLEVRTVMVSNRPRKRLHLVADPILTFWNPLDVPVVIPRTAFFSVKYWQIPYDLRLRVNGRVRQCPLMMVLTNSSSDRNGDSNYLSLRCGELEQLIFKPGEIIKVSQSGNTIVKGSNAADHNLQGRPGFNFGGGVSLPMRDAAGQFIDLAGSETITYEAIPNNLTSGQTSRSGNSLTGSNAHSRHFSLNHHEYYVGTDRRSNSLGIGGMYIDWDFGNQRLKPGETRATNKPGTKNPKERLYANEFPDIFRRITLADGRPLTVTQLDGRKEPIMLVSYNAKTENGSDRGTRSMSRLNPKVHHVDFYDLSEKELDMLPYEFSVEPLVSWRNRSLETSVEGNAYFGGGLDAATGTSYVSTHSVPMEPLASLGAFQHSFANGFEMQKPTYGYATLNGREPMLPQISHAIGNSAAAPMLKSTETKSELSGGRPLADHSYLANEALFDDWFLSSIAPKSARTYAERQQHPDVARAFLDGDLVLPNSRYVATTNGLETDELITRMFRGAFPKDEATTMTASLMRVLGMFNVNSTSVEAWKVVLGGLNNKSVMTRDEDGMVSMTEASPGIAVAGLVSPLDEVAEGSDQLTDPGQWAGRRVLSEDEIQELAEAIVREVRKRGPFLSLADFVNRRVGSDEELARAGAIQSALDSDEVSINEPFRGGGRDVSAAVAGRFEFPAAEEGPISQGIAGIVKQGDILTPIAPVLSARSDSFVIRGYGESTSPTGEVLAQAWCEAVVERDNQYLDPEDTPETLPDEVKETVNAKFGRRYRVVSFRWLNRDEV